MGIEPAKIPSRRDRLVVSPERREQARAGMDGEQTKSTGATAPAANVTPAPLVETPAAVVAAPAPAPTPEPVSALELPAAAAEPTPAPAPAAPAPELPAAVVKPAKPVAAAGAKRGRGRPPLETERMGPQRPVKIPEDVWEEIRLSLVLLPKGEDLPRNIKAYLVAAHRAYDAQLRKQGKLPAKQPESK